MDRDKNLLFGVFAVQLNKISPLQLAEAADAWAAERLAEWEPAQAN